MEPTARDPGSQLPLWRSVAFGARRMTVSSALCAAPAAGVAALLLLGTSRSDELFRVAQQAALIVGLSLLAGLLGGIQVSLCGPVRKDRRPEFGACGREGFKILAVAGWVFFVTFYVTQTVIYVDRPPLEVVSILSLSGAVLLLGRPLLGYLGAALDRFGASLTEPPP